MYNIKLFSFSADTMKRFRCLMFISILLCGCAGNPYLLTGDEKKGQELAWQNIGKLVISRKQTIISVGSARPLQNTSEKAELMVAAMSPQGGEVLIPQDIKAYFNGTPVRVYTGTEIRQQITDKQETARFLSALAAGMAAAGAAQSAGAYRQSGYVSGVTSSGQYVSGNYTVTGFDQRAASDASANSIAQSMEGMSRLKARQNYEYSSISDKLLTVLSLSPNRWEGGVVFLDPLPVEKDGGVLHITVNRAKEKELHEFWFQVKLTP